MNWFALTCALWLSSIGFFGPVGTLGAPVTNAASAANKVGTLQLELEDSPSEFDDDVDDGIGGRMGVGTLGLVLESAGLRVGTLGLELESSDRTNATRSASDFEFDDSSRSRDRARRGRATGTLWLELE